VVGGKSVAKHGKTSPNEIVVREVKRDGGFEVFNLLAECVSQTSQAAHVQARGCVESFNV
jgi:hypothetical protein